MMTNKFAFLIIKTMELFAFRHRDLKYKKVNNYSLIYVSISPYGNYRLTLCADWLYSMRHKEVLTELNEILRDIRKEQSNFPMFSISIEKENIGNEDIDELVHLSSNYDAYDTLHYPNSFYFISTKNILLNSGINEDGYILKSKVLPNFQFEKELLVSSFKEGWAKIIPISFQNDKINFLKENDFNLFRSISDSVQLKKHCSSIDIFDINMVETVNQSIGHEL